jgi:hypothetical protein
MAIMNHCATMDDLCNPNGSRREFYERLFIQHPKPEVHRMASELKHHKIKIRDDAAGAVVAYFNHDDGRETLGLNPVKIGRVARSEADKLWVQSYLYHEAIHHEQYHRRPLFDHSFSCEQMWLDELEAYKYQCQFAAEVGVTHLLKNACDQSGNGRAAPDLLEKVMRLTPDHHECRQQVVAKSRL